MFSGGLGCAHYTATNQKSTDGYDCLEVFCCPLLSDSLVKIRTVVVKYLFSFDSKKDLQISDTIVHTGLISPYSVSREQSEGVYSEKGIS